MSNSDKFVTGAEEVRWDLSDLYSSHDDENVKKDMENAEKLADQFAENYRGKVASLDADGLAKALAIYEQIIDYLDKLGSFAYLSWSTDTKNQELGKFLGAQQEFATKIDEKTLFFSLEWAQVDDKKAEIIKDDRLDRFSHFLEISRLYKPYMLTEPEEKLISRLSLTGKNAWSRYYDELLGSLRYKFDNEELRDTEIRSKMHSPDREERRKAADSITEVMENNKHAFTYIFNMVTQDKSIKDDIRGHKSWISSRNLSNQVSDKTVDILVNAVTSRYDIVERYYNLLKKQLGYDELYEYDRYAPIGKPEPKVSWEEAKKIVLDSFSGFSPKMADIAELFFENSWIDAPPADGKSGGAYSASTAASVHPFVFMNFDGEMNWVSTLAHELGHGVHQYLSKEQGQLQAGTPLTTAEMASTFGEMLVFDHIMNKEKDPEVRFSMRMKKAASTFATVFRQISMNRFEHEIHNARREQGELTTDQLSEFWQTTQQRMFGKSLTLREGHSLWWAQIPHFVGVVGYVYAYAFGELLVWALYAKYKQSGGDFTEKYLNVLKAGGSDWPHNILAPLGVDLQDPEFWNEGLNLIDKFVRDTEKDGEKINS